MCQRFAEFQALRAAGASPPDPLDVLAAHIESVSLRSRVLADLVVSVRGRPVIVRH